MTNQEALVKAMVELYGTPYLWDGKADPDRKDWNDQPNTPEPYFGVDCSGSQTLALKRAGGPDNRLTFNAAKMAVDASMIQVDEADGQPGDLCLYALPDGRVHHVMMLLFGGLVIGAAGGDQTTLTQAAALAHGAKVMVWPHRDFMSGWIGSYRRWPFAAI